MSTEPPPGSGQPPDDDPFKKQPPTPPPGSGSPYGAPPPSGGGGGPSWGAPPPPPPPPPPSNDPYGSGGGGPYGGEDPLAGMPPLADSGKRVLARIIDMILVGIVVALLSWGFGTSSVDVDKVQTGKSWGQSLIAAILYIAYDTVLIARTGQTLGKRLLKMRVANLSDGATPSVQTSLIRAAVLWLPFAFCCACIWTAICGGWSFFDKPYKQGLHDKAAKTVEVTVA
ncbi:RDD family protein [Streptomyces sp. NPDC091292]|uniref:RDD family protein n=1 Tax=Streptomyces sp. NPDC091292 TaxID=3365991 RepID=UPI0037F1A5D1